MIRNKKLEFLEQFNSQPNYINYKPIKRKFTDLGNLTSKQDFIDTPQIDPILKSYQKRKSLAAGKAVTDAAGLQTAYGAEHNVYTNGDTLYIAGTSGKTCNRCFTVELGIW